MAFEGLQDRLEQLTKLRDEGILFGDAHAHAMKALLSSFGLGDAGVTATSSDGQLHDETIDFEDERGRRVEILIHNLSHSDMALSVNDPHRSLPIGSIKARPKFGDYRDISERLLRILHENKDEIVTIEHPLYSRSQQPTIDGRYPIASEPISGQHLPVGFDLSKHPLTVRGSNLHFKGSSSTQLQTLRASHARTHEETDASQMKDQVNPSSGGDWNVGSVDGGSVEDEPMGANNDINCVVDGAFFPLLSVLVHKWLETLRSCGNSDSRKIVILISGRGTPTDPSARSIDNSTKASSKIVQKLLGLEYPTLQIITLHSTTNLFRYDENIVFVKRELVPIVDHIRNDLAHHTGEKWKDAMGVTISFADGSSARVSAINQSLSHYRPSYMHFWQLKTFWVEGKLCDDDIECHSFEEITTQPALSVDQTPSTVRMAVAAMQQFRSEFECIMQDSAADTDLANFWLRKTKKPVLAVLLVQKPGSAPKIYRGTNMEVSMPTGSLCAERNVIGSALAADITLKRQDLKVIVVYSAQSLETPKIEENLDNSTNYIREPQLDEDTTGRRYSSESIGSAETTQDGGDSTQVGGKLGSMSNATGVKDNDGAVPQPALTVDVIAVPPSRQLKRRWSDSSAGSCESQDTQGSPNRDRMGPRSPIMQGQKRKILSMPNKPIGNRSSTGSSSTGTTSPRDQAQGDSRKSSVTTSANQFKSHRVGGVHSGEIRSNRKNTRKIRPSFSSGGLLGLDSRHEIFNMGDDYEPEVEHNHGMPPSGKTMSAGYGHVHVGEGISSRTFTVQEHDMNPLKPCGACTEWLKKIASVNPQFTVVTFTDYECEGVYLEHIVDT